MLRLNWFIVIMLEALKLSLNDIVVHVWFWRVLLRILVVGERCNVTGEYFKRGSTSEYKTVIGYWTFARELCIVNREFSNRWCPMNTLVLQFISFFGYWWWASHGIDKQTIIIIFCYYYSQISCKCPPKMQRLSGRLQVVVTFKNKTTGHLIWDVQTHLLYGRWFMACYF